MTVAVIADIVGSRKLPDRAAAQHELDAAIDRAEAARPLALQRLAPTVGDELQGVYRSLGDAVISTLMLQLALPAGIECRFGVGVGELTTIPTAKGAVSEGPGWWAAREAIDLVHEKQQRTAPLARTWIVAASGQDEVMSSTIGPLNSYLLVRDQLVGSMSERERRLTYGRAIGTSQRDLAIEEGISQPSISKSLRAAGSAAILDGLRLLQVGHA